MLSTQQPTEPHQFEHSNQRSDEGAVSPRLSSPAASLSAAPSRGGKAVTPATVIAWLREHYKLGKHGYSKKAAVFAHYQALCAERGAEAAISSTFFGKLVKRAFPEIKTIRKGPRGKVEQCYDRLKPIDPAKASRARWLERMNLYLTALQSSAQGSASLKPPTRQQEEAQVEVIGGNRTYASGLDGGHFLASLLPTFDSPSPSSSFTSSPAPSSPTAELVATRPLQQQEQPHNHYYYYQQHQQQAELPHSQEAYHHQQHRHYYSFEEPHLAEPGLDHPVWQQQQQQQQQQQGGVPWVRAGGGSSRSAAYLSTALSPTSYSYHPQRHQPRNSALLHASGAYAALLTHEPSPLYGDDHDHHLHDHPYPLY